jgi:hypothetical protein
MMRVGQKLAQGSDSIRLLVFQHGDHARDRTDIMGFDLID